MVSKKDLTEGICHQSQNQDDKTIKAIFGLLKQTSSQQNMVFMGDFKYTDFFWEYIATPMTSIKFLECVEDCFLTQMSDVPTRNEALLYLLLTKQDTLLLGISMSHSPLFIQKSTHFYRRICSKLNLINRNLFPL